MDEPEWLGCNDPDPMVEYLGTLPVGDRKARLFAVACLRHASCFRPGGISHAGLAILERYVEGQASEQEVRFAWSTQSLGGEFLRDAIVDSEPFRGASYASAVARGRVSTFVGTIQFRRPAEGPVQAGFMRDIFGPLPFRTPQFDPRLRAPPVRSLAQAAYEERVAPDSSRPGWLVLDPARLLVLADALEEAGCDEQEILAHLRGSGEHVRGCFAVEFILGKE